MSNSSKSAKTTSYAIIMALACAIFFMFAMTTDAVGTIIAAAKKEMNLTNTQATAFHWPTMIGIAVSGIGLGFLADKFGRKFTIILGLALYGIASGLFMLGKSFELYMFLLFTSGIAIGVFKTAALALVGDISSSTEDHTFRMNLLEGFFGIGAIVGPLLVTWLTTNGIHWSYLYLIASAMCALMVIAAFMTTYPEKKVDDSEKASFARTLRLTANPYALGFSMAIMLYVAFEAAVYVLLPEWLEGYGAQIVSEGGKIEGNQMLTLAAYAVTIFFVFRAVGRFLGALILRHFNWKPIMVVFTLAIFLCFSLSVTQGRHVAVWLIPLSGLFMSMIYPTVNSKGISCFKKSDHGAIAGIILFFTAVAAAGAPLLMAWVSDTFAGGDLLAGFWLATAFSGILFLLAVYNWIADPAASALNAANATDYEVKTNSPEIPAQ